MAKDNEVKNTTEADKIWTEISNIPVDIFSLPNQKVSDHVEVLPVPGSALFLKPKTGAVLPALETALAGKFTITQNDGKYLVIERVPPKVTIEEDFVVFQRPNGKVEKIPRNKF